MTKQPSYRFRGYTESWAEKKLGEVSTSFSGGTPAAGNKKYYGGEIPFIRSAEINSDKTELFLTKEGLDNSSAKLVKKGDILYALYGATSGEVGISKINGAINQAILSIIPKTNYTSEFIMQWLRLQKKNIIDKYLQGGQGNLSGSIVKELGIFFPSLPEQTAIGSFFQDIDQLISLQQRKLEVLKEQKKTYLKLLFPAKGQTKPALRFSGFEDEWKEVKLGEAYSFSQGQQVPVEEQFEQINENRIRFIRIVDLTNKGEEMRYIEFKSSTGRVYEKDIFFVRYGAVGVVGIGYDGIIANNLFKLNPQMSVDNKFMYVQFNREKFKKTLQGFSASTTMPAISFTDIRTIDIYLPSLPEQTAIGSFFQDLDKAIAKQEEKVNQFKESKQTLLRKMFI